jgi:hypothetical protein
MDDQPQREMTVDEGFDKLRALAAEFINLSEKWFEGKVQPPVVQEVVLARRAVEDARMRLGVAKTKLAGNDPWSDSNKKAA